MQPKDPWHQEVETKETRKLKARTQHKNLWFGLGMFGLIGWSIALPTAIGTLLGVWLDKHYPGRASWTLTALFASLLIGCYNAWYWISLEHKRLLSETNTPQNPTNTPTDAEQTQDTDQAQDAHQVQDAVRPRADARDASAGTAETDTTAQKGEAAGGAAQKGEATDETAQKGETSETTAQKGEAAGAATQKGEAAGAATQKGEASETTAQKGETTGGTGLARGGLPPRSETDEKPDDD